VEIPLAPARAMWHAAHAMRAATHHSVAWWQQVRIVHDDSLHEFYIRMAAPPARTIGISDGRDGRRVENGDNRDNADKRTLKDGQPNETREATHATTTSGSQ
jgi:hypothetical protein